MKEVWREDRKRIYIPGEDRPMDVEPEYCGCYACIGNKPAHDGIGWLTIGMTRMILCAECGNKRCPHGTDHRYACTGSNEPGQPGSRYPRIFERPPGNIYRVPDDGEPR